MSLEEPRTLGLFQWRQQLLGPKLWTAAAVGSAFLACGALLWLTRAQRNELRRAQAVVEYVGSARIDLAKGALRVHLAKDYPSTEPNADEGMALVDKAIAHMVQLLRSEPAETFAVPGYEMTEAEWVRCAAALRAELLRQLQKKGSNEDLRLAYASAERFCERVDNALRAQLNRIRRAGQLETAFAAVGTAGLLVFVGFGVFLAYRKEARARESARKAAEALRESRTELALFIEHAPAALAMFDREMRYLSVSRRWMRDYNISESVIGRRHYEVFPEIGADWKDVHCRAMGGETVLAEQDRFVRADGSVQWLRWEVRPWKFESGEIGGVVVISEDITARVEAEQGLAEANALYKSLVDQIPVGIFRKNAAGRYVFVNDEFLRLVEGEAADYLGRNLDEITEIVRQRDGESAAARARVKVLNEASTHHGRIMQSGETIRVEEVRPQLDGSIRYYLAVKTPVFGAQQKIVGSQGVLFDLTPLRQAEAALSESEARFFAAFQASPVAVVITRRDDGHIVDANPAFERLLGTSKGAVMGRNVRELGLVDDNTAAIIRQALANRSEVIESELTVRTASGEKLEVLWSNAAVVLDGRDCDLNTLVNITERKRSQAALQLFRTFVDESRDAFEVIDLETGRYVDFNGSQCRELGYTREELLTMRVLDVDPTLPARWPDFVSQLRAQGQIVGESVHQRRDGSTFPIEYSAQLVRLDRDYCVAVVRNIAERKQVQEALRLSEAKFAQVFSDNAAAIAITRLADGLVLDVNETWVRMWGYSREEIIGQSARFMWSSAEAAQNFVSELRERGAVRNWEQDFSSKSGKVFTTELWSRVLQMGGEAVVVSTLVDITARRQAEEQLRTHQAILEETGRIAKVGGWSFDPKTGEGTWTDEVARIHDLDPAAETSREIGLSFYTVQSRPLIERAVMHAVEHGTPYDLELELISAKGVPKWVRTIGHPEIKGGQVVRVRGSFQDITERKRTERQLLLQAAVGRVLSAAKTREEASQALLRAICASKNFQFGAIWSPADSGAHLRCDALWQEPGMALDELAEVTRQITFPPGVGLPGVVWKERQVWVFPTVANEPNYLRRDVATRCGLRSALAFPVVVEGEVVSVVDFPRRRSGRAIWSSRPCSRRWGGRSACSSSAAQPRNGCTP